MATSFRCMVAGDLEAVDRIQRASYRPDFREDIAVFEDKLARYPSGCWVYEHEGVVVGYLFSHPGYFSAPPSLNKVLGTPVGEPDCYFIHDVAVLPSNRGKGVSKRLISSAFDHAAACEFSTVTLVAVQDAKPFWERHGFRIVADSVTADAVHRSYGPDANYMVYRSD